MTQPGAAADISDLLEKILDYLDDEEGRGSDLSWVDRMRWRTVVFLVRVIAPLVGIACAVGAAFWLGYSAFEWIDGSESSGAALALAALLGFFSAVLLIIFWMNR
ncbi:MAG: hypothetical protein AAGF92_17665 [Myxococcota bacterium]